MIESEPGLYALYGEVVAGPAAILDGYCPRAAPGLKPTRTARLHQASQPPPCEDWEVVFDDERSPELKQMHLSRVVRNAAGLWRFTIDETTCVECDPLGHHVDVHFGVLTDPDTAGAFFIGTALMLYFRAAQRICLHGALVRSSDRSVLICDPSGAGKSTFAAALHRARWEVLSEDLCLPVETPDGDQGPITKHTFPPWSSLTRSGWRTVMVPNARFRAIARSAVTPRDVVRTPMRLR